MSDDATGIHVSGRDVLSGWVDVTTPDGVADTYLVRPDDGATYPGVLFFMDGIGLRRRICDMADRLASNGYVVLVPNLYYRAGRAPLVDGVEDLLMSQDRGPLMAALAPFMGSLSVERVLGDVPVFLDYLAAQPQTAPGPAGLTGYCMGGRFALLTAGALPDRVAAAGSFHGGGLATDAPDSPHLLAGKITAELYFGHADNDGSMNAGHIALLESALTEAGVRYGSELYSGAVHGYTMSDSAAYHEAATERHWTNLLALLRRNLPAPA